MMYHCRFIDNNKCTTLLGDVDSRETVMCGGKGNIPSAQFCFEPKTALKNSLLRKMTSIYISKHEEPLIPLFF